MHQVRAVCVYAASSTQVVAPYFEAAHALGVLLAHQGIRLVNGAGNLGLMKATADACLQAGGQVTGVIPRFMVEQGWHHTGLTELVVTDDMHTRKQTMAQRADAVIALPGGCGTMEELLEIITWKQLGLYLNPIVILNTDGFYTPLLEMLQRAVDHHFMRDLHSHLWAVAQTPQEAVQLVRTLPVWNPEMRKFAAI